MTDKDFAELRKKLQELNQPALPSVVLRQMAQVNELYRAEALKQLGAGLALRADVQARIAEASALQEQLVARMGEATAFQQQVVASLQDSPVLQGLRQVYSGTLSPGLAAAFEKQKDLTEQLRNIHMTSLTSGLTGPISPGSALDILRLGPSPQAVLDQARETASRLLESYQRTLSVLNVSLPVLEAPALEIDKLAVKGWMVDPLLMVAPDDTLYFLEAGPSRGSREEVALVLQDIVQRNEKALGRAVDDALKFLLGEGPAYQSHSGTFAVALRAVAQGGAVHLVTQAMLARTEGVYNLSFRMRGFSKRQVESTLYSSKEELVKKRQKVLTNALEQAHERQLQRDSVQEGGSASVPHWQDLDSTHERLIVACAAFSKGSAEDDDELAFDSSGARNHAQHDGLGTETLDWAVRVLLWFAGMALVLSDILPELPPEVSSVPQEDTN